MELVAAELENSQAFSRQSSAFRNIGAADCGSLIADL
jgi:hypothetical protein